MFRFRREIATSAKLKGTIFSKPFGLMGSNFQKKLLFSSGCQFSKAKKNVWLGGHDRA